MLTNKKAVTTVQGIIIVILIVVAVAAAAFVLGSAPAAQANTDITVYIDSIKQTGNYTQPQTLDWGSISAGNTYTKNYTVTNTGTNPYALMLLTTEPAGTTQTWAYNNTVLNAASYIQGTLTLTLSTTTSSGAFTWRLYATNSTMPEPSTSPDPSATPTPLALSFTVKADNGVQNINVTINSKPSFTLLPEDLPKTYSFTSGDDFKFEVATQEYYTFNGWELDDGSAPQKINPLILPNRIGNFSLSALVLPPQT